MRIAFFFFFIFHLLLHLSYLSAGVSIFGGDRSNLCRQQDGFFKNIISLFYEFSFGRLFSGSLRNVPRWSELCDFDAGESTYKLFFNYGVTGSWKVNDAVSGLEEDRLDMEYRILKTSLVDGRTPLELLEKELQTLISQGQYDLSDFLIYKEKGYLFSGVPNGRNTNFLPDKFVGGLIFTFTDQNYNNHKKFFNEKFTLKIDSDAISTWFNEFPIGAVKVAYEKEGILGSPVVHYEMHPTLASDDFVPANCGERCREAKLRGDDVERGTISLSGNTGHCADEFGGNVKVFTLQPSFFGLGSQYPSVDLQLRRSITLCVEEIVDNDQEIIWTSAEATKAYRGFSWIGVLLILLQSSFLVAVILFGKQIRSFLRLPTLNTTETQFVVILAKSVLYFVVSPFFFLPVLPGNLFSMANFIVFQVFQVHVAALELWVVFKYYYYATRVQKTSLHQPEPVPPPQVHVPVRIPLNVQSEPVKEVPMTTISDLPLPLQGSSASENGNLRFPTVNHDLKPSPLPLSTARAQYGNNAGGNVENPTPKTLLRNMYENALPLVAEEEEEEEEGGSGSEGEMDDVNAMDMSDDLGIVRPPKRNRDTRDMGNVRKRKKRKM